MTREHMQFLADSIRKYNLQHVHFTTGQCLQMHGLDGDTILKLYKECYDHGIYNRGAGGDNPNVVASILRGIDPRETLDITPYATAISEFLMEQMFYIKLSLIHILLRCHVEPCIGYLPSKQRKC